MRFSLRLWTIVVSAICALLPHGLIAAPISFASSSGNLAATASFNVSGTKLLVTLDNTSTHDVLVPADVLNAVFFDITGNPTLTRVSATISAGGQMINAAFPVGGDVGGEWAFKAALSGAPGGGKYGISSAGFGLFGPHDMFPGSNLDGTPGAGGMGYGLLSMGDNTSTGNSPITTNPFTKHSVVFVLDGLPAGFHLSDIKNVHVQYGTDTSSEPSFEIFSGAVPEPASVGLIACSLSLLLSRRRRSVS